VLGRSEDVEVLRLLHAEAARPAGDPPAWQPFLQALAALTRAQSAALAIEAAGTQHVFATTADFPLPARATLLRLRSDRLYAQDELEGEHTPLRLLRAPLRGDRHAWLIIRHPLTEFRAADGLHLSRLAPHLGTAVETWLSLARERAQAQQSARVAAALGAGWLWLDATGRVLDADDGARLALDGPDGPTLGPGGRIDAPNPEIAARLRRGLDAAASGADDVQVVPLAASPLLALAIHPGLTSPAPGVGPVLRAAIRRAPAAIGLPLDGLARSMGLSRSETRLAVLLCDGSTLAEAAVQLGWTIETARSASKRIYAQTETRGQGDLIRQMWAGADWFQNMVP